MRASEVVGDGTSSEGKEQFPPSFWNYIRTKSPSFPLPAILSTANTGGAYLCRVFWAECVFNVHACLHTCEHTCVGMHMGHMCMYVCKSLKLTSSVFIDLFLLY